MSTNKTPLLLFKYGGNAMTDQALQKQVIATICGLREKGYQIVVAHGGGPFIRQALEIANVQSEFIGGHRKTTPEAFQYVEMALKGKVNSNLVEMISNLGHRAVGLSGRDGGSVTARRRFALQTSANGDQEEVDLGQVGDVATVDISLLRLLLDNDYVPVITCTATGEDGLGYNINGDMFAGHVAGALGADHFIVLTDVDGLLADISNPDSLIERIALDELPGLEAKGIIAGGMLPKAESCSIAIQKGAASACILNGTSPDQIPAYLSGEKIGTTFFSRSTIPAT